MLKERQFEYNGPVKRAFGVLLFLSLLFATGTPASAQSGSEYFAQTGHFVSGDFLAYYRSAPNAEVLFGYPITEAFTKNGQTIQYFQRARFELHPELPAGQRVQRAPLGSRLYQRGDRLETFNPFACRYFARTGFSVCYAFLDFFKKNGGEAQFGQPISPFEFHNGLIVQYFEYARFEWKPSMPENQRVALTDLGSQYFTDQKEDANLLAAVKNGGSNVQPLKIQARAFVWKTVTLASDNQIVYVIVQDQNMQPLKGAQGSATVRWPDNTTSVFPIVTNESGVGIVSFNFTNQPYGQTVIIDIFLTKDGLVASATTSFRIWY